jgi:cytochrome c peroxidase
VAQRVRIIPEYAKMFIAAFDDVDDPMDITITHIANAIGAFEGLEWQSYDSPFDAFLNGDTAALSPAQRAGAMLFYGKAGCADCHSGPLLTDQEFHALALPGFGPGRTRPFDPIVRDVGRMAVTDRLEDAYRFKTPSLRNVALTAPYGHNGAYPTLEGIVRHHLQPLKSLTAWTRNLANLPEVPWLTPVDFLIFEDSREQARLAAQVDITPRDLSDTEIAQLIAFLNSLTGTRSLTGRLGRPSSVPSGLKVD